MTRMADLVPTRLLLEWSTSVSQDRADSLQFRLDNEKQLLERASQRFIFGWGRYGRSLIYDPTREIDTSVTDGFWIITIGQFGLFGFLAEFGLLTFPIFSAAAALRFTELARDGVLSRRPCANPRNQHHRPAAQCVDYPVDVAPQRGPIGQSGGLARRHPPPRDKARLPIIEPAPRELDAQVAGRVSLASIVTLPERRFATCLFGLVTVTKQPSRVRSVPVLNRRKLLLSGGVHRSLHSWSLRSKRCSEVV